MCSNGTSGERILIIAKQLRLFSLLHLLGQMQQDEYERRHTPHLLDFYPTLKPGSLGTTCWSCPQICFGGSDSASSWSEAARRNTASKISIASWNADALRTSLTQAMALNFDILALQELKVDEPTALGLYQQAKKQGYLLIWGHLPGFLVNGKKVSLTQKSLALGSLLKINLALGKLV